MTLPNEKIHVLLIYRVMIPSVRLCGHCQLEELARRGLVDYRAEKVAELKDDDLNWADIVFLGRLDSWYEHHLAKRLSRAGKYLIYILDDDLLHIPQGLSSSAYYCLRQVRGHISGMIGVSNAVLSPSPLLLEKYAGGKRRGIRVMEPAVDPVAYRPHGPAEPVRIGFAGSMDRMEDVEQILGQVLPQIRKTYGEKVCFEFFGPLPSFAGELDARHIPYCDSYDEYRKTLNDLAWDIGLAPMPDTPFHACKHYNKFTEYAAAGIVGIYSDVSPYTRLKEEIGIGVFCKNTVQAWYEAISGLIENGERREQLRESATRCASERFSVAAAAEGLWQQLEECGVSGHRGRKRMYFTKWSRYPDYIVRVVWFFRRNGLKAPTAALKKLISAFKK